MLIPLPFNAFKWSNLVIDTESYLFPNDFAPKNGSYTLNKIELCSNMYVKNIYLCNEFFNQKTIPKEMQFLLKPGDNYEDFYDFFVLEDNKISCSLVN